MESLKIYVGKRIKELREKHGLSQKALAEAAQTSDITISAIERGATATNIELLGKIAKQLDTSPALLMGLSPAWGKVIDVIPDLDESKVSDVIRVVQGLLKPPSLEEIKGLGKKPGSGSDQTKRKV